jgi:isoquinoline 1-oxidoreductase beta subunit
MSAVTGISRRTFLRVSAAATGGLLIGFHLPDGGRLAHSQGVAEGAWINAWLRIGSDERITILVSNSEMGQGVFTALPMLVAEELEVEWEQVHAEMAPADPAFVNAIFGMQATGGSTSVRSTFEPLRRVGASARELLVRAAAERWGVEPAHCRAVKGRVEHPDSGQSVSYGELAADAAQLEPDREPTLKDPKDWEILGKSQPRLDLPQKVDGSAVFGIDVHVEGMRIATVRQCPVFGGRLATVDPAPALAVSGVERVVNMDDAVVVVADGYWPALQGSKALAPTWDPGANADLDSDTILEDFRGALDTPGALAHGQGDVDTAMADATQVVEASYHVPFLAHATMEPMTATAAVSEDGADIWAPTQAQGPVQAGVASLLGLDPGKVRVNTTFLGGGFGRRFELDFIIQAVRAAVETGAPVKLIWSREEDIRHDFYRPASVSRFRAGLNQDGLPVAWDCRIVCPSIFSRVFPDFIKEGIDSTSVEAAVELPYAIANQRIDYVMRNTGVPVGFWRSVGNSQNAFFVQSFIDELAHVAGTDPLDYQLRLLEGQPRHQAVLRAAAELADWGGSLPEGRGRGLAIQESFGSIVAEVAEVSVSDQGDIRVHRVACAVDCGRAVNPDTVEAQMQSGIVFGLTALLHGDITVRQGQVQQGNFDSYRMLQLADTPAINVQIIESGEALGGIGEPGTPPLAPAVANAIFALTGVRVRHLPIRSEDLKPGA